MGRSVGSLLVIRRALNEFCENHHLPLEDKTAIEAAQRLIGMSMSGENSPEALRLRIEEWFLSQQAKAVAAPAQDRGPADADSGPDRRSA